MATQRRAHIEDPGAEMLDRASSFWNRYGRLTLGVVGVLAAAGVIGFFTIRARAAAEEEAAGQLTEANLLFWQGEYARSLQVAKQVVQQFPSTWSGTDALRLAGDDAFWNGDWKGAVDYYRRFLEKNRTGLVSDAARRAYGYALESDGQSKAAADQFEALVGKFDRESSAEFLVAAARNYRALHQPEEAAKRLQRVLDEFGETSFAATARIRLGELRPSAP
ncbi:MAG TPA: tetratricopeptide repeat protein [Candidatus Eisenbacteria bacterium]